jgi:Fic family protein
VLRLQSQAALIQHGAGSGLWSVSRGFARSRQTYYERLAGADEQRMGADDGNGALSEKGLVAFAKYFLETCLDQVTFMAKLLDLATLRGRILGHLRVISEDDGTIRVEAGPALYHVFLAGSASRGEFKRMTGMPARTAERALAALLRRGLLESDSPKGPVRVGLPLDALSYYFPLLYPEATA